MRGPAKLEAPYMFLPRELPIVTSSTYVFMIAGLPEPEFLIRKGTGYSERKLYGFEFLVAPILSSLHRG